MRGEGVGSGRGEGWASRSFLLSLLVLLGRLEGL